jgi:hypothetical protein
MILDTIDLLTKFYNDPTNGVNAQLRSLLTGSYASPTPIALIVSELTNNAAAQERVPSVFPNISVFMPISDRVQPNILTSFREGKMVVDTRYCVRGTEADVNVVQAYQVTQAIMHCLDAFVSNTLASFRQQNGIMILGMSDDLQVFNSYSPIADAVAAITVRTIFDVRDTATFID